MTTTDANLEQIRAELTKICRTVFFDPTLNLRDDMTAADVEGWDSLNHINLIVAVERAFRIKITLAEIQRLDNVGALVRLIGEKAQKS